MAGGKRPGAGRPKGARNKATVETIAQVKQTGLTPLDYMLSVMRDSSAPTPDRMEAAKSAAPYVHARLTSVDLKGEVTQRNVMRAPMPAESTDQWLADLSTQH